VEKEIRVIRLHVGGVFVLNHPLAGPDMRSSSAARRCPLVILPAASPPLPLPPPSPPPPPPLPRARCHYGQTVRERLWAR